MAGRLLNKSCYRVHNQKAKYFLRKDCSTCFYATPQKGLSVKNQKIKTENCSSFAATAPKKGTKQQPKARLLIGCWVC